MMITKSRARASLAEVMTRHRIKFSDAALTEMVSVVFGEKQASPLSDEGKRAMGVYAECVGYRIRWGEEYATIFEALGKYPSEDIRGTFEKLVAGKWYVENCKVPTPEAIIKGLVASKDKANVSATSNEYGFFG